MEINELIAMWDSDIGKPYKGALIDMDAYRANPESPQCFCAQGQALHYVGGMSIDELALLDQQIADRKTADLLNISFAHAVLLRIVNDSVDGAPSIVLTNPEKVIGDQAKVILAFWRHLERMTPQQWDAALDAGRVAARAAARGAARAAARGVAWVAARGAAWDAARGVALDAGRVAAWDTGRVATWDAARDAASYATAEIMGARILREQDQPFFFLPMFGFADPEAVMSADQTA